MPVAGLIQRCDQLLIVQELTADKTKRTTTVYKEIQEAVVRDSSAVRFLRIAVNYTFVPVFHIHQAGDSLHWQRLCELFIYIRNIRRDFSRTWL